jgi:hypothetical protein
MKCSQQGLREVDKECFIGKMDKEGFLCTRVWKEIKPEQTEMEVELWSEDDIDALMRQCYSQFGAVPFLESYSHTDCVHWKIMNTFTQFREEKLVLGTMEEGLLHSLKLAVKQLTKIKSNYIQFKKDSAFGHIV